MKRALAITIGTFLVGAMSANAEVVIAGWDNFTGSDAWVPNHVDADTTVSVSATTEATTGKSWGHWNYQDQGASGDGTFGSLSSTVLSADTGWTANNDNLSLNSADGTIVFTLTNDSGVDREMAAFYFDAAHKNSRSADTWALTFGGAISGSGFGDSLAQVTYLYSNDSGGTLTPAADRDHAVDLSGLTDNVWEANQDIVLTLAFTGSDNLATVNGGNELMLDNIAVTVTPIPEPATLGLMAILCGGLVIMRRRRS